MEDKKKYLDYLYCEVGRQNSKIELSYAKKDKEGNAVFTKWKDYHGVTEDELKKANNRTILLNEVIIDLEDKKQFPETFKKIKKDFKFYSAYETGSRGYHIHLFFDKNLDSSMKEIIIKKYGGDLQKSSERCMIALELNPHWKTGKLKKIIEDKNGINKFVVEDFVDEETFAERNKVEIERPKSGRLISKFVRDVSEILKDKNLIFYRPDFRDVVEIGKIKIHKTGEEKYTGFNSMKPSRFITLIERYIIPIDYVYNSNWKDFMPKEKSIGSDLANTTLLSQVFQQALPQIDRIFSVPIPIIYNGKLTFPKKGYDFRFSSWLPYDSPEISNENMGLEEAKGIIYNMFKEFCFKSHQDYINAIAGLLTPFLRGLFPSFNTRVAVPFYIANRPRCGKDYLAGITGIVYEGYPLEEDAISSEEKFGNNSSEELRKLIMGAMIKGRKRLHFSNNKGYINNPILEGVVSKKRHSGRVLGKSEILEFDNEIDFSLSGNMGVRWTTDLGNRSIFIRLFLADEDVNKRKFENPKLQEWVLKNRDLVLSALYSLVRNWISNKMQPGKILFASFPEWAEICGGVMESAGYESPCKADEETLALSGDVETQDMKKLYELCYEEKPDEWIKKKDIKRFVIDSDEDLFNYLDLINHIKSDEIKFGNLINKFIGREESGITLVCKDEGVRGQRRDLKFTKISLKIDKKKIFGDDITTLKKFYPRKKEKVVMVGNLYTSSNGNKNNSTNKGKPFTNITHITNIKNYEFYKNCKEFLDLDGRKLSYKKGDKITSEDLDKSIIDILINDNKLKEVKEKNG